MNHMISFISNANADAFIRQNSVSDSEIIERGLAFIIVDDAFMSQADWIESDHVFQINRVA